MKHQVIEFLSDTDLDNLLEEANKIREQHWGKTITYSRKVFVPLTNMCRNTCSYCTFVKDPDSSVSDLLKSHEASVLGFVRYELGEGIPSDCRWVAGAGVKGRATLYETVSP